MSHSRSKHLLAACAIVLMAAVTFATWFLVHPSIAGGLMGRMLFVYAVPVTLGHPVRRSAMSRARSARFEPDCGAAERERAVMLSRMRKCRG